MTDTKAFHLHGPDMLINVLAGFVVGVDVGTKSAAK